MRFRVRGPDVDEPAIRAIAVLTDHARVRVTGTVHDEAERTVTIPLDRVRPVRRRIVPGYSRGGPTVPAIVIVRAVRACRIRVDPALEVDTAELLFGLKVEPSRVYACSAEEHHGHPLFELEIEIDEVDVTLEDRER